MKRFQIFIWRTANTHISFGIHLDYKKPNIEIHLPFCFLRIGWDEPQGYSVNWEDIKWRYIKII